MQIGNMAKDCGDLDLAKITYEGELARLMGMGEAAVNDPKIRAELYDVYVQLGHLNKLRRNPAAALDNFRKAARIQANPELLHEINHVISSEDHYLEKPAVSAFPEVKSETEKNLSAPTAVEPPKERVSISLGEFNANQDGIFEPDTHSVQCVCWSKSFKKARANYFICNSCGTAYRRSVCYLNEHGISADAEDMRSRLSGDHVREILQHAGLDIGKAAVTASINLDITTPQEPAEIHDIRVRSDGIQNRGQVRCQFDRILIPNLSQGLTDVRRLIDDCLRLLRPGGYLVFGAETIEAGPDFARSTGSNAVSSEPKDTLFRFSKNALRGLLIQPLIDEVHPCGEKFGVSWFRVRKKPVLSLGVMSGIGDAAWSLLLAHGVIRKYGASHVQLHIHHSGDVRAKRSNNMLARFRFVDEIVGSKFDIHAHPPMNDITGHINYIPSGPVALDSPDEFDYRLVFNTFLERGWSLPAIADFFGLSESDINYDFFDDYEEKSSDLRGYNRSINFVGKDYVVFHFGAREPNTTAGLNAGEIWKPEDWLELGRKINSKYGAKIIVIGASYDLDYANDILGRTTDNFYLNVIGQMDITETLALIKRSRFTISFPSGVGIVGPYMNVPTCIFWRAKDNPYHPLHPRSGFEREFATNWAPPEKVETGLYYPAWYGTDTPESIVRHIEAAGWWEAGKNASKRG